MSEVRKPDGYAMYRNGKLVTGEYSGIICLYRKPLEEIAADDVVVKPVWIYPFPIVPDTHRITDAEWGPAIGGGEGKGWKY